MGIRSKMEAQPDRQHAICGACANCGKAVFEELWFLDDAYAVWEGICPHCGALNYLSPTKQKGMRGYDSRSMYLELPTKEEVIMNGLPPDSPTQGWDDPSNEGKTKDQLIARYG